MKHITVIFAILIAAPASYAEQPQKLNSEKPQDSLVIKCQKQNTCRFHVIGALTPKPKGVFSVTPKVWENFTEMDKAVYRNMEKIWLHHVANNPENIMTDKKNGGRINPSAPILPRLSANIQKNLKTVEFFVATSKMDDGSPGWSEGQVIPDLEVPR